MVEISAYYFQSMWSWTGMGHKHGHTHMNIITPTHQHTHTWTYAHTSIHTHEHNKLCQHINTHIHMNICRHINTHTHEQMPTATHTHTHARTHIHTEWWQHIYNKYWTQNSMWAGKIKQFIERKSKGYCYSPVLERYKLKWILSVSIFVSLTTKHMRTSLPKACTHIHTHTHTEFRISYKVYILLAIHNKSQEFFSPQRLGFLSSTHKVKPFSIIGSVSFLDHT